MSAPNRIDLLRQSNNLVGMDFVRVADDQMSIDVFLHHKTPLPIGLLNSLNALKAAQIHITSTDGSLPLTVKVVDPLPSLLLEHGRRIIRIPVVAPGGFGLYQLFIDSPVIDKYFNNLIFTFKAGCTSDLDCKPATSLCLEPESNDFPVDYRARDFWSIRQALIDFAAQRFPDWQDRLEADFGMVMLELMAGLGDEFSYAQDRIARETHFDTASQRRSLRHLARLVDYQIDNGSGARTWLDFTANANGTLLGGAQVCDANQQIIFEVGHGLRDNGKHFAIHASSSVLAYIWDENATCLPAGSTKLTLQGHCAALFDADSNIDSTGKWVLLGTYPAAPDAPQRRLMVRVPLEAALETADLITASPTPITEISWEQPTPFDIDLTVFELHVNLIPATAGETKQSSFRVGPAAVPVDATLPVALERVGINAGLGAEDINNDPSSPEADRVKTLFSLADTDTTPLVWLVDPVSGVDQPEIQLSRRGDGNWDWLPALVGEHTAAPTEKVFTLEDGVYKPVFTVERFGEKFEFVDYASAEGSSIRFGDNEFGLLPGDGSVFDVIYRVGNGRQMNIAQDSLVQFYSSTPAFISSVTNPLAANGGSDPETDSAIRINAPQQFRTVNYRAVKPEDFRTIVERELKWVQRAGAQIRWTGSWPTVFVTPDPRGQIGLLDSERLELTALTDRVRQAGREVKVKNPRYVSIDIEICVCVAQNAYRGEVEASVLRTLFGERGNGGFFAPDNFTFGTPLSRASLMATIQAVSGVRAVEQMRVRRKGLFDWRAFNEFSLSVGSNEVIQIANERFLPERGAVTLIMEGGA